MLPPKPIVLYQVGKGYMIECPLCRAKGTMGANESGCPDLSTVYYTCNCVAEWNKKNKGKKLTDEDKGQGRFF